MLVVRGRTALERYGKEKPPGSIHTSDKLQRRATLCAAFAWARRWPVMKVMTGCGFRPLAVRLLEQEAPLPPPAPIPLDTPEQRRAYYMGLIFACDGLLRMIVLYL